MAVKRRSGSAMKKNNQNRQLSAAGMASAEASYHVKYRRNMSRRISVTNGSISGGNIFIESKRRNDGSRRGGSNQCGGAAIPLSMAWRRLYAYMKGAAPI